MSNVEKNYDQNTWVVWDRLERHRIEFQVTLRALAEFLPEPPVRLIDIGSGPGRYATTLAQRGFNNSLTGAAHDFWLDIKYRMARAPSLLGASDHLLYFGRP
jgi:hypothetical protein